MRISFPKDSHEFSWTTHIKNKMLFYGLTEQRIRRVYSGPTRVEEGVAENTVAAMQSNSSKTKKEEIWIMYQKRTKPKSKLNRGTVCMISAWRYPGESKPGAEIPIPDDIREELSGMVN